MPIFLHSLGIHVLTCGPGLTPITTFIYFDNEQQPVKANIMFYLHDFKRIASQWGHLALYLHFS